MRGYLGGPDDKDWFVITPATTGVLRLHVTAPDGVDIVLLHDGAGKAGDEQRPCAGAGEEGEREDGSAPHPAAGGEGQPPRPKTTEPGGSGPPPTLKAKVEAEAPPISGRGLVGRAASPLPWRDR